MELGEIDIIYEDISKEKLRIKQLASALFLEKTTKMLTTFALRQLNA